jgi:hypothetical protein
MALRQPSCRSASVGRGQRSWYVMNRGASFSDYWNDKQDFLGAADIRQSDRSSKCGRSWYLGAKDICWCGNFSIHRHSCICGCALSCGPSVLAPSIQPILASQRHLSVSSDMPTSQCSSIHGISYYRLKYYISSPIGKRPPHGCVCTRFRHADCDPAQRCE